MFASCGGENNASKSKYFHKTDKNNDFVDEDWVFFIHFRYLCKPSRDQVPLAVKKPFMGVCSDRARMFIFQFFWCFVKHLMGLRLTLTQCFTSLHFPVHRAFWGRARR